MEKINTIQFESELDMFTGTQHWYKHMCGTTYTDGIKYLADKAQAYWLLDIVASYQPKHKDKPFQIWKLTVNKDQTAVVTMKEDSNKPIVIKQKIPYTDFPLHEIEFYCIDGVMLLKSEY